MRKDTELFLYKVLEKRSLLNKNSFIFEVDEFSFIPNIESCIKDIIDELKLNNCITKVSKIYINNQMSIDLTLEGIHYFEK